MLKPRSLASLVLLLAVYLASIVVSSLIIPLLWGGFAAGLVVFFTVPFFCLSVVVFYCGALCMYFGYRLDSRAPMGRLSPLAILMAAIALPLAYQLSIYWGGPDPIGHIRQYGW
jgi:hypothetical protein